MEVIITLALEGLVSYCKDLIQNQDITLGLNRNRKGQTNLMMCGGEPVFAGEEGVYTLDGTAAWDYLPEKTPIEGVWQSGPVELDRVRTVTRAGLLLRPESGSGLVLSLATDRRGAWGACPAGAGRLRYSQVD